MAFSPSRLVSILSQPTFRSLHYQRPRPDGAVRVVFFAQALWLAVKVGSVPCLAVAFRSDNGTLSILGRLVLLDACRRDGLILAVTFDALARI